MQAAAYKRAFQPAKSGHSFGRKLFLFLLIYKAPHLPAPAGQHHNAGNIFSYRANLSLPVSNNLHFHQSLTAFIPSTIQPPNLFQPSSSHSLNYPPTKKTEPSAQFFPLYISSTFPGLYNPQFSSCSTKPKCLRMPAKSGSLLLSSVITGLSFSSHSRLNSISLLPRPL